MEFEQDKFATRFSDDLDAMGQGAQPPAPTTPVPTPEEFEAQRLSASVNLAREQQPDTAVRVFKMQQKTGLPTQLIERNLDIIETKAAREDFNAEEFRKTSPMVAKWLADNPNHAAMAQHGYDDLSFVESLNTNYQAAKTGFMGGFKKQQLMGLNYRLAMEGSLSAQEETERQRLNEELKAESLAFNKGLPMWVKEASDILGMQVAPVGTSVKRGVQVGAAFGLTGLALSAVSGPLVPVVAPITTTIGAGSGFAVGFQSQYLMELYKSSVGESYGDMEEYVKSGAMDQTTARHASMIAAIPNAALEMLSFGKAAKIIPGADKLLSGWTSKSLGTVLTRPTMQAALADFGKKYADAVVTETITEGTQALITATARELARGREAEGLTAADFESVLQQSMSAFRGTALLGALGAGPKVVSLRQDMRRAQENENYMRSLGEVMARTQVPPEAMGDFIKSAAPDTNVHIPVAAWNMLFQDKAQTAAQELLGSDIAQYTEANAIQGDIIVPLSRYAEKVAPSQYHEALLPDLRLGAGELSVREVMAAQESGEMQKLADEASEQAQRIAAQEAPLEQIYDDAYQQQIAAKVPAALAKRNALIVRERLRARAQRLGRDPLELYQEQPLNVKRFQNVPTGAELGQAKPPDLAQLKYSTTWTNTTKGVGVITGGEDVYTVHKKGDGFEIKYHPADHRSKIKEFSVEAASVEEAAWLADRRLRRSYATLKGQSKYSRIPAHWEGEAKKLAKKIIDAGYAINFSGSTQSTSKYLTVETENGDVKIRLADHDLPVKYEGADIDLRYGALEAFLQNVKGEIDRVSGAADSDTLMQGGRPPRINTGTLEAMDIDGPSAQSEAAFLFQFAGRRSLTANPLSLNVAAQRVMQGDNPETVRKETGWFKGADDKWRYEISDKNARAKFGVDKNTPVGVGMAAKRDELQVLGLRVSDVLDHPLLFAAYPQIANYPISDRGMGKGNRGAFAPSLSGGGMFFINGELTASEALSTLLHEIQHAIQNVEGFASGGSKEIFIEEFNKLDTRLKELNKEMNRAIDAKDDRAYFAALAEREEIVPRIQELQGISGIVGYEQYLRLAGEVEARNVQFRAAMTEEERRIMAPELTADFDKSQVIVIYNGELLKGAPTPANAIQAQTVFHGTPHAFDRFSLDAIGTGEGAQAYGWGLYFAGKREIAEYYRDALANTPSVEIALSQNGVHNQELVSFIAEDIKRKNGDLSAVVRTLEGLGAFSEQVGKDVKVAIGLLRNSPDLFAESTGNLYQVAIPEDSELLDWDKPLSEQPEGVKAALLAAMPELAEQAKMEAEKDDALLAALDQPTGEGATTGLPSMTGEQLYEAIAKRRIIPESAPSWTSVSSDTADTSWSGHRGASMYLNSIGIPGLRYLDSTSRKKGEGTHNYVIWDESRVTVEAVNDELRQAEQLQRMQMSESFDQEKRGFFIPPAKLIGLLPQADASTFIHELGHSWLEELRMDALSPNASEQLKADWEMVKQEIGATDTMIPVDAHEKFAEMTESYIMEGQAPSAALREVIMQFKEWLSRVYRALTMTDTKMSDDIRGVMDRLIATDEAIEQARDQLDFERTYLPREGMTDAEYAEYLALNKRAREEAEDGLRAKVMRFMKHQHTEAWRDRRRALTKEVLKNTLEEPFYRALYWLQHGTLPDGSAVEGLEHARLDVATLRAMSVTVEKLPLNIVQQDGIHPDILAPLFGMKSGDAFVKDLIRQPSLKKAVDTEVKSRLAEEFNDFSNNDLVEMASAEAQKHQVKVFIEEMKILRRLGARAQGSNPAALKALAHKMLQDKPVGEVKAYVYAAAARAAGREAERAMTGKQDKDGNVVRDLNAAFAAKQRQVLNTFLHQEASEIEQGMTKSVKAWRHQFRKGPAVLGKTRNMDLVNTANAIAAAHGITSSGKTAEAYMLQLRTYDPVTYQDMKPIVDLVASDNRPWGKLTVAEFQILKDTIDGLWELSRNVMTVEIEGQRMERKQVVGELNDRIEELNTGGERLGYHKAVTNWEKTKMTLMGARAALRRVEHWVDAMDGTGVKNFRKYLWKPVSDAAVNYRAARADVLKQYLALTQRVEASLSSKAVIDASEIGYEFSSKAELLGALLHTGNESNLQKLLRGRNWGAFDPSGTLDTSKWDAFIARAQREGILTKADYDYAQDVWNLLETLKPGAQKAHRQMYGFYFSEVTAQSFSTPFGDYKGGYFPAITDPFAVEDAALRADQRAIEEQPSSFMFPTTGRGFAMLRVQEYAKPLSLDLGLAPQHIQQVLRFTHLEPVIKDVGRIAIDKEFRAALGQLDSQVASEMLIPWLQRSARQTVMTPSTGRVGRSFDKLWSEIRKRTGLQIMTGNVTNTLQQFTGFSLAATQVKPRYLAGALWRYTRAPFETTADINTKSKFMEGRTTAAVMEVQQAIDDIVLNPSKYAKARDFAMRHGYFLQSGTQNIVDVVTWSGAYEQAITEGAVEAEAIDRADSAVRETQGSFAPEDISRFEAGTAFVRTFTMFYSYFNMQANLLGTEFAKAFRDKGGFGNASPSALYLYTMGFMIPAVLSEALVRLMGGEYDDDDEDGYLDDILSTFFMGQVRTAAGLVPIAGPLAMTGINQFNDRWYDDRISTSPAISTLQSVVTAPYQIYRVATEDDVRLKGPIRDTLTALGMLTGLPVAPLSRPLGYLADEAQGYTESEGGLDTARGLITGKASQ